MEGKTVVIQVRVSCKNNKDVNIPETSKKIAAFLLNEGLKIHGISLAAAQK